MEEERVYHHHHTYDADQSEVVSVSALNPVDGEEGFHDTYNRVLTKLRKKHAWGRANIKTLRAVISNKLTAERQMRQVLESCATTHTNDEDSMAALDGERTTPRKDLVELIAGGTLVEVDERITRFQEMLNRAQELEIEIATQSKALPKLTKDIQKRENKLKVALDKIKRKSHDIREDFRAVREKDRLRKRIEALKLEGKYFEVNQLERLNRDRKQTVANMLPELEKRENDLKELICCSANSLRAQAEEYDTAAKHIVASPPPIVPRHCYTSDFLENGHPRHDDRSSLAQTETEAETETTGEEEDDSAIWETTTTGNETSADGASITSSDTGAQQREEPSGGVGKRTTLAALRPRKHSLSSITGRFRQRPRSSKPKSNSVPSPRKRAPPPPPRGHDRRGVYPKLSRTDMDADARQAASDENDPSRMNTTFVENPSVPDHHDEEDTQVHAQQEPQTPLPHEHEHTQQHAHEIDEAKHDDMHGHLPPHLRAQAHLQQQHHQQQHPHAHDHGVAHYEGANPPRAPLDYARSAAMIVRTPSRSRSRNYDETLSPVAEREECHIVATGAGGGGHS